MIGCSAVILASGKASRLGVLCRDKPKCMIEFNGNPFIRYVLDWLHRSGIREVVITCSESCNGWMIRKYVAENFPSGVRVVTEECPENTVRSSYLGISTVTNRHTLLMTADNIWDVELGSFASRHLAENAACTALVTTQRGVPNAGLVKIDKYTGRVLSFADHDDRVPGLPVSTMGLYVLDVTSFLKSVDIGSDVFVERETMNRLIPDTLGIVNDGFFYDFGTPERLEYLLKNHGLIPKYFGCGA